MKYLRQFMLLLLTFFLGEMLQLLLHLPIPGAILGFILLFVALCRGIIQINMIEEICDFLLSNMAFLFIPAGVGLISSLEIFKGKWISFLLAIIISTIAVWTVTAFTVKLLRRFFNEGIS